MSLHWSPVHSRPYSGLGECIKEVMEERGWEKHLCLHYWVTCLDWRWGRAHYLAAESSIAYPICFVAMSWQTARKQLWLNISLSLQDMRGAGHIQTCYSLDTLGGWGALAWSGDSAPEEHYRCTIKLLYLCPVDAGCEDLVQHMEAGGPGVQQCWCTPLLWLRGGRKTIEYLSKMRKCRVSCTLLGGISIKQTRWGGRGVEVSNKYGTWTSRAHSAWTDESFLALQFPQ